jgi:hypothetical protein
MYQWSWTWSSVMQFDDSALRMANLAWSARVPTSLFNNVASELPENPGIATSSHSIQVDF